MAILTALLLGFLMILDPCTLFTSIAAIGYIDREMQNRRRVLITGLMFVLGKLLTYVLLAIPFIMGAQTATVHELLHHWGEPLLCAFMMLCGILLLVVGHHHHDHDHGVSKWLQTVDDKSSWLWAFMLGIFFAIAFCPHRLVYFFTMVDTAITLSAPLNWILPIVFGLGTGLPIMLIAWLISYSAISAQSLSDKLRRFEKWFRYACAALFIGYGLYLGIHLLTDSEHHEHEHTQVHYVLPV
ncbi:MAG: sulfite exporter TauE/SafE family protein [Bacteroidales bacterium]|jgi:cytochrome c biogenesis protein CcdA|nr:sulfite exporter TauE/SafE family protein [Bacteroidales bacterium]